MTDLLLNPLAKQLPQRGKRRETEKPSSTLKKKKHQFKLLQDPTSMLSSHLFLHQHAEGYRSSSFQELSICFHATVSICFR